MAVKFPPREALIIIEAMKAIMALNPELFKNCGNPEFNANAFIQRVKAGLPTIDRLGQPDVEEMTEEADK